MAKLSIIRYAVTASVVLQITGKVFAQTSPADYFRSSRSGSWNAASSWESSSNGYANWIPATLVPTTAANTITIQNSHVISITGNTTVDQVIVASGGTLELATASSSRLTINNDIGNDVIIQSGGIFKHNLTAAGAQLPAFAGSAAIEIQNGGILEIATGNGNPSDYANTASSIAGNMIWDDASIFNWNTTANPADGITYFPASPAIPVFRFSAAASIGNSIPTVINGMLEANANVTFQSAGSKTIRNGIVGNATVAASAASVGQFIISGATAKLGGGILVLPDAGLSIASGTDVALTSNKTINKYSAVLSTITIDGALSAGDYTISGNCKIQITGTVKTTNVNGLTGGINTTFATGVSVNFSGLTSTIEYNRSGDQTVTALSYTNLVISGSGSKNAAGADVLVSGTLNIMAGNTFLLDGVNDLKLNGGGTVNISANATFDNGGESRITGTNSPAININGNFITRDAQGFSGTGSAIPSATVNIYNGSTIEYGRAGDQQVSSRNDYKNITFSGSGIKTLATFAPNGTVTIKDNAIADAANKTFGDSSTNLTMIGGRFKVAGSSTKPDIAGTYNLTGGIIEFAGGTTSSRQNIRSSPAYLNIEVTGPNVGNSNSSTKLANGGSFTIKTGGYYENSGDKIDGSSGTQTFTMEHGATFKTGVSGGFSGSSSSALYNIETINIDPKSTIIYSRLGDQVITPLAGGYPTFLLKGSGIKTVSGGTVDVAATADSVVIDPLVVFKVGAGAKANFNNIPAIIHSNVSGTGIVGEIIGGSASLLNAANVTVERFIPARRAFRFISPAVTSTVSIKSNWMEGQSNPPPAYSVNNNSKPGYGIHITGSADPNDGFDVTATNNPSLFGFDNLSQSWRPFLNTTGILSAGSGYRVLVRGSRSTDLSSNYPIPSNTILRTTGTLTVGPVTYNSGSSPSISPTQNYYSLVGNPYASPVNWDDLNKAGVSSYYIAWDPNLNIRGAYATYGNGITAPSNSNVNANIQSQQAFFVRTTTANPSIIFNEANKTVTGTNVFRGSSAAAKLSVRLLLTENGEPENTADGVMALFDDNFNASITSEDANKLYNLDENLSIVRNKTALSIESRKSITSDDTVFLEISQLTRKKYYLRFEGVGFSPTLIAFVKDRYLKKQTNINLKSATLLAFDITKDSASFASDRFSILFKPDKVLPVLIKEIKAYKKEQGIEVEWKVETDENTAFYTIEKSVNGLPFVQAETIQVLHNNISKNYTWFDVNTNVGSNCYRIKITGISGNVSYTLQACVNMNQEITIIKIYPNPIRAKVINLQLNNAAKALYNVQLFSSSGDKVYSGTINCNGNTANYSFSLPGNVSKGNYKLQISSAEKVYYYSIIIN